MRPERPKPEGLHSHNVLTAEIYFEHMFPGWKAPEHKYVNRWLWIGSLEEVMAAIEEVAQRHKYKPGGLDGPDHAGRLISMRLAEHSNRVGVLRNEIPA